MARYNTSITVRHSPDNMFELVSDIARYPDFIRWIKTMQVSDEREDGGVAHCVGDARVGFRGFSERFATTVRADKTKRKVEAKLLRGPFKRLHNTWTFSDAGDGQTRINFDIDYEFNNFVLQMLARSNLKLAVDKIMGAFLAEADRRYAGRP